MIIVTGGAGFIGSAIIWKLNKRFKEDIIVVDSLGCDEKWKNLVPLTFKDYMEKDVFLQDFLTDKIKNVECVIHMGACSDTQEQDASFLMENNFEYTKKLAQYCVKKNIKFLYASSAATYGNGAQGYSDSKDSLKKLKPLNMYAYSKHLFDLWANERKWLDEVDGCVTAVKYFNIFGPNEYHKGEMRSLVNKAYYQIKQTGKLQLFKSYLNGYKHGEQKRDFLYVKDAVNITLELLDKDVKGIYNIGSGNASTWNELAGCIFKAMDMEVSIEYVDMPDKLKDKYQYFTQAEMDKTMQVYESGFMSLEDAVWDYVVEYLDTGESLR